MGGDYTKEDLTEKTIALTNDGGRNWNGLSTDTLPFQSSVSEILVEGSLHLISAGPAGTFCPNRVSAAWASLRDAFRVGCGMDVGIGSPFSKPSAI